jgi:prepilin-type N-terminal cleavage/methylation domain-containing protein
VNRDRTIKTDLRPTLLGAGGRPRGFTLVEMSVVVLITGIIAATVIPAWNSLTGTRQAAAAEEIERQIIAARSQALAEGRPVGVRVDPANDTVQRWVITAPGAAPTVATMIDGQPDAVLYIPGAYMGAEITTLTAGDGTKAAQVLWFGFDGSPQLRDQVTGNLIGPWTQDAVITIPGGQQVLIRKVSGLVQR